MYLLKEFQAEVENWGINTAVDNTNSEQQEFTFYLETGRIFHFTRKDGNRTVEEEGVDGEQFLLLSEWKEVEKAYVKYLKELMNGPEQ